VDYAGGTVVPFACDLETRLVTAPLDGEVHLLSLDVPGEVRIPLEHPMGAGEGWGRYVAGVVEALREAGMQSHGFRGVLSSTIPAGAGLSSSAALESVVALALLEGERPAPHVLQRAEHLAVGVPCGVMDQVAVLHGVADHALAIDCAAVTWSPLRLPSISFVVVDTGTRRGLDDGRYAQRRSEVEEGLERRLRHVETENRRVADFISALGVGNLETMGGLVDASHASLRDNFEVSSPDLDRAVEVARTQDGCLGARLIGAGFAGCVLALVRGSAPAFVRAVEAALPGSHAVSVSAVDGAGSIEI
jgi:galactokinase